MSLNLEQYAGNGEYPVLDAGDYEVTLKMEKRMTKDGSKDYLNCDFIVRGDIEQKFQGSHIFDKIWRDTANPHWFDLKKLASILVTQKDKAGYKTSFDEVDECIQYLNGIDLKVTVEKKYDDYFQREVNEIKYLSYKPSTAVVTDPAEDNDLDDDLPF